MLWRAAAGAPVDDQIFLRLKERPHYEQGPAQATLVDLFAGCGGLTLGWAEAARLARTGLRVVLAVDSDKAAAAVYRDNFPSANIRQALVEEYFPGDIGEPLTERERRLKADVGQVTILTGGPPCQGHSDLNNHTRRKDPRNSLYLKMVRAAEVLSARVVLIENVPAVLRDTDGVVDTAKTALEGLGYAVADQVVALSRLGVPQHRRRHVLLATVAGEPDPATVLMALRSRAADEERNVSWAIGDLENIESTEPFDRPGVASPDNAARMKHLFDHDLYDLPDSLRPACHRDKPHTYRAMYGRLKWSERAPTLTTGFGSMGQGRYVHPSKQRTLTPHEAARLQMLPDFFRFSATKKRGALLHLIGNAVPPPLSREVGRQLLPHLVAAQRVQHRDGAAEMRQPFVQPDAYAAAG